MVICTARIITFRMVARRVSRHSSQRPSIIRIVTESARPTTREQRGWYVYDWAQSAFSTTVVTTFLGPYLTDVAQDAADAAGAGQVTFLGIGIRPETYFPACVTLSVLLQLFLLPVVGAWADRSAHKRWLLGAFAYLGSVATMALVFLEGTNYHVGGVAFVVANVAFGAGIVVYNSFLPEISGPDDRDRVSSHGWALGYAGGGLLLAGNLALFLSRDAVGLSSADAARICLLSAGVWWAAFTLVPLTRLRDRPPQRVVPATGSAVTAGFRQLAVTVRDVAGYRITMTFLVAFLLYNDGIQTVIAYAGTFGTEELGIEEDLLALVILVVQIVAFIGALMLGRIAQVRGAQRTVLAALVIWAAVVGVAFVLPAGNFGAFLLLAVVIGFVLGGSQALSRSLFSHLLPAGREAEYFALYEVTDRGTTLIGSLLFTVALEITGSYRVAILGLVVFFVAGFVVLRRVDFRAGAVAVGNTPPGVV
jgi:UMF1 family MFS transporter